jgi:hypothetical protein
MIAHGPDASFPPASQAYSRPGKGPCAMMLVTRHCRSVFGSMIGMAAICSSAAAQVDTANSVQVIVPCSIGTAADPLAHAFAKMLSDQLARSVHVGNRPIAGDTRGKPTAASETIILMPLDLNPASSCGE